MLGPIAQSCPLTQRLICRTCATPKTHLPDFSLFLGGSPNPMAIDAVSTPLASIRDTSKGPSQLQRLRGAEPSAAERVNSKHRQTGQGPVETKAGGT